jgi:hypothetical protein
MQPNQAGDLVGPERECVRADGRPKVIYSAAEAAEWTAKYANQRYETYLCSKGHWHVGHRMRRPIVAQNDGA